MYLYDILHLNSEQEAEEYLQEKGVLSKFTHCIHCNSTSLGRIRRGKYKCYNCKREWSSRKGSILESFRLDNRQFLLAIKSFSLNLPYTQCAVECNISKSTSKMLYSEILIRIRDVTGLSFSTGKASRLYLHKTDTGDIVILNPKTSTDNDGYLKLASIELEQVRTVNDMFSYIVSVFQIASNLDKKHTGIASKFYQELSKHLAAVGHIDRGRVEAELFRFILFFNSHSKNIAVEILKICSV